MGLFGKIKRKFSKKKELGTPPKPAMKKLDAPPSPDLPRHITHPGKHITKPDPGVSFPTTDEHLELRITPTDKGVELFSHKPEPKHPLGEPAHPKKIKPVKPMHAPKKHAEFPPLPTKPIFPQKKPEKPHIMPEQVHFRKQVLMERSVDADKPLFVKARHYESVLNELNSIRKITKKGDGFISSLHEMTTKTSSFMSKWQNQMEDIQRKLIFIDQVLFEELEGEIDESQYASVH